MNRSLTLVTSRVVEEEHGEPASSQEDTPQGRLTPKLVSPSGYSCNDNGKCPSCSSNDINIGSSCPPHGAKAVCGRRSKMEDMFVIQPDFIPAAGLGDLQPMLPRNLDSVHVRELSAAMDSAVLADTEDSCGSENLSVPSWPSSLADADDSLHLFAVYDGHGGVEAAKHCSERMHCNILKAWEHLSIEDSSTESGDDEDGDAAESKASGKSVQRKTSDHVKSVLHKSFVTTDTEFIQDDQSALVGSTAVVSMVGQRNICVGYCGDSRAVLCRDGKALPLTVDHKPERDDETERVQDAGGQVLFFNGARVMGLLAMSRAIGDRSLRPFVIPDPEVTIIPRLPEDQLLILASDGLWDVVNNQEACTLAMRCMQKARDKGACDTNAARLTATVLTRAAMDRGSRDNITVVVVDLRPPADTSRKHARLASTPEERPSPSLSEPSVEEEASEEQSQEEKVKEPKKDEMPPLSIGEGSSFENQSQRLVPVQVQP